MFWGPLRELRRWWRRRIWNGRRGGCRMRRWWCRILVGSGLLLCDHLCFGWCKGYEIELEWMIERECNNERIPDIHRGWMRIHRAKQHFLPSSSSFFKSIGGWQPAWTLTWTYMQHINRIKVDRSLVLPKWQTPRSRYQQSSTDGPLHNHLDPTVCNRFLTLNFNL